MKRFRKVVATCLLVSLGASLSAGSVAAAPDQSPSLGLASPSVPAARAPAPVIDHGSIDWLEAKAGDIDRSHTERGWSYVISGGVVLAGSIPGFYLSKDLFAQAVFSIGQTLGVAAVGYGTYLVSIRNDYSQFVRILKGVPELSIGERNHLARQFLVERAATAKASRRIRVITHSLTGLLNLVNGVTASSTELKTALFFLAGINALAAGSFAINPSEEEQALNVRPQFVLGVTPKAVPIVALTWHF